MIARLAWRNVLSRADRYDSLHYPSFVLALVTVAAFYAFGTVDEQLAPVEGGALLPPGISDLVRQTTFSLSWVLALVALLLGSRAAGMRGREVRSLWELGLSRAKVLLMWAVEQAMVLASALVCGLPIGILFSHVLVFVTAAGLGGRVVGFRPFLSPAALQDACLGLLPLAAAMLVAGLFLAPRATRRGLGFGVGGRHATRRGSLGPALALLAVGLTIALLSSLWLGWPCLVVLVGADGHLAWSMRGTPVSLVLLLAGNWFALRGIGGVLALARGGRPVPNDDGAGATRAVSRTDVGFLFCQDAMPLAIATVCLAMVALQLAGALGSAGLSEGPLVLPAMAYLGSYSSFILAVAAGTILSATVGGHAVSFDVGYLALLGLGVPAQLLRRQQVARVLAGFCLPAVLATLEVALCLVREGIQTTPYGEGWSTHGILVAAVLGASVLAPYLVTTLTSVRNSLRQEARARQLRW